MDRTLAPAEYRYPPEQETPTVFSAPMLIPSNDDPGTLVVQTSVRRFA